MEYYFEFSTVIIKKLVICSFAKVRCQERFCKYNYSSSKQHNGNLAPTICYYSDNKTSLEFDIYSGTLIASNVH